MTVLTGPLFSLTARNSIGNALTYSAWRGIQYARTRVIPANPQTAAQTAVRDVFATLNNIWNRGGTLFRAPWTASAEGQPLTDRNRLVQENVPALQGDANLADFVFSPGAGGAVPPVSATFTPGAGTITVVPTPPSLPTGWTIQSAVAVAILDGDPSPPISPTPVEGEDLTSPYSIVLSGLSAALYRCGVWLRWTAPDGSTRYSTAIVGSATPT